MIRTLGKLFTSRYYHRTPVLWNALSFGTSTSCRVKEIRAVEDGDTITVEGVTVPSDREPYKLDIKGKATSCHLCNLGLEVKHTDVLILSQYVRADGCMLSRRVTGLCKKQQRRVTLMVAMAQKAGLMPNLAPHYSKKDPTRRQKWKKWNKYFDESTIEPKLFVLEKRS